MNQYNDYGEYIGCVCSDGTEFLFDADMLCEIRKYNWFRHRKYIEGNVGGNGKRVTVGKVIGGYCDKPVLRIDKSVFDYRRSNLFIENESKDLGEYATITTIDGQEIVVDVDDLEALLKFRWYVNSMGYAEAKQDGRRVLMHRFVVNAPEDFSYDEVVDHINRNKLDNRKSNLRIVTQAENVKNCGMRCTNTSGHIQVATCDGGRYYRAHSIRNGKKVDLGVYDNPDDASQAIISFEQGLGSTEELAGRKKRRVSESGHKYIYRHGNKSWTVCVCSSGKHIYLGCFHSLDEAVSARDEFLNN